MYTYYHYRIISKEAADFYYNNVKVQGGHYLYIHYCTLYALL